MERLQLRYGCLILLLAFAVVGAGGAAAENIQKQPAGPYVIELRVSPRQQVFETMMLFTITDADGKPVDTTKASGHANFSSGGLRGRATLYPDGVNRMKGYGLMSAKPNLSIEVSITIPDTPPLKAIFRPLQ